MMRCLFAVLCLGLALAGAGPSLALERCPAERLLGYTLLLDSLFGEQRQLIRWPAAWDREPGYYLVSYHRNIAPTDFLLPIHSWWMGPDHFAVRLPASVTVTVGEIAAGLLPQRGQFTGRRAVPALVVVGLDATEPSGSAAERELIATVIEAAALQPEIEERWAFAGDCRIARLRRGLEPGVTFAFLANAADNEAKAYCVVNAYLAAGGASGLGKLSAEELLAPMHDGRFFVARSILSALYGPRGGPPAEAGMSRCTFLMLMVERTRLEREGLKRRYAYLPDEFL